MVALLSLDGFAHGFADRLDGVEAMLREPDIDSEHLRQLELTHVLALMSVGRAREAHAIARRIRPTLPIRRPREGYALRSMFMVGLESGEAWDDLELYAGQTLRQGVRAGDREAAGLAAFTLGSLAVERGRYRDAGRWLSEAEAQLERRDTFDTLFCIRALQIGIACAIGDVTSAQAWLESARELRPGDGELMMPGVALYAACAEGWAARALGDAGGVRRFEEEAAAAGDSSVQGRLLYEALLAGGRASTLAAELTVLADRCDNPLLSARAAHAVALAARDGQALVATSQRLSQIGADVCGIGSRRRRRAPSWTRDATTRRAGRRHQPGAARRRTRDGVSVIDGLDGFAAELSRARPRSPDLRPRPLQRRDRRPTRPLGADRGDLRVPGHAEARRRAPPRAVGTSYRGQAQ